ncbi:MAG: hypothetical protein ACREDS_00365 [Limisphaerales bacterium]
MNRPFTKDELKLIRWMLEHGKSEAQNYLSQLENAEATSWRCPCGCASINFSIKGQPKPLGGIYPIADFIFGTDENLSGVFIFTQNGILAGLEVYGLAGDGPKSLPLPESLRPFSETSTG